MRVDTHPPAKIINMVCDIAKRESIGTYGSTGLMSELEHYRVNVLSRPNAEQSNVTVCSRLNTSEYALRSRFGGGHRSKEILWKPIRVGQHHRPLRDALEEIAATAQGTRVSPRFMTPELGGKWQCNASALWPHAT
jgi:hypothetical protein